MQAAKASAPGLRFDGLYQSPGYKNEFTYYLRFFADGVVVGVTSSGDAAAVSNWLNHSYNNSGKYKVQGNKISFSVKSAYGVVDYNGVVTEHGLELNIHSHINGNRYPAKYTFVRV